MGAKCSKSPENRYRTSSRFAKTSRGPSPNPSPARNHGKRMGFADASSLGATPPRPLEGGWGLKFADMKSQELSPTGGPEYRSKAEKRRLARTSSTKTTPSTKTTSVRSFSSIVAKKGVLKFSEVLRGAGTVGLGALDTFSSSVANVKHRRGFAGGAVAKGNKIGILAFEVANTIVKGCNLKMTLGEEDMKILKEDVLVSESVQRLVSNNPYELLLIAAADKRNELKVFTDEVVRFGNHCKDSQWHGYDRVFRRLFKETEILRLSSVDADRIMDDLMLLAQNTADLYHELHALDRFRTDLKRKQQEEVSNGAIARGGETVALLKSEVKSQEKHVEGLKKRSLWSRTLEEVMEQLIDIAIFLYQEIYDNFGPQVFLEEPEEEIKRNAGKLGSSGLALHYANLINQIDSLVQRPGSVPPNTRDNLYQALPPSVKTALRARLRSTQNGDEYGYALTITELKGELDKLLSWLVPVASNTTKAHHGFGWVGEWANTGSPADRRAMGYVERALVQTLHHANQKKVENYILELIVGLHHLVNMTKANSNNYNLSSNYNNFSHNNNNFNNSNNNFNDNNINISNNIINNNINNNNNNINNNNNNNNNNSNNNSNNNNGNNNFNMGARSPQNKSPARIHIKPAMEPPPFVPSDRSVSPPPFGMFSDTKFTEGLAQQLYPRKEHSQENQEILHNLGGSDYSPRKLIPGLSKSLEPDHNRAASNIKDYRKTSSHSQASTNQFQQEGPLYRPRNRIKPLGVSIHERDSPESLQHERR